MKNIPRNLHNPEKNTIFAAKTRPKKCGLVIKTRPKKCGLVVKTRPKKC